MSKAVIAIVSKNENPKQFSTGKKQNAERRALWVVSVDDAKKICKDKSTIGQSWMLAYWLIGEKVDRNWEFIKDDGRFNDMLDRNNISILQSKALNYKYVNEKE